MSIIKNVRRRAPSLKRADRVSDEARGAGMGDEAVRRRTGRTWKQWVRVLDRAGAHEWSHRQIARHLRDRHAMGSWWAQAVTIGYERIKGLRVVGQRRDGSFEVNKSRTIGAPVSRLYAACARKRGRAGWLPEPDLTVRASRSNRWVRAEWADGTLVDIAFRHRGVGRTQVTVQHRKLPSQRAMETKRRFWHERLTALAKVVS